MHTTPHKTIDFWFDCASNYSYISIMRIEQLAKENQLSIRWQPFILGPIFQSFGWNNSPFVLQKQKGRYMWQDMIRECKKYGLPWQKPTVFPRHSVLAMRIAVLGRNEPWIGDYCRAVATANFVDDQDISSPALLDALLRELSLPSEQIMTDAISDENKQAFREQVVTAQSKQIFGAPTFFVGDEMFWGNDRLDDAIAYATRTNS